MRGKLAALGVAAAATLSGCSALTGNATAAVAPPPARSASPGPMRVITVPTPTARTGAPALSTTGTSWLPIMKSLTAYGQWLLANPDPALTGNVATPGCGQATLLGRQLDGLLTSSAYVQTAALTITQVVGPKAPTGRTAALIMVASRPAEPVLSATRSGVPVTTIAPYGATTLTVTLNKGADKGWRLCDVTTPDGVQAALL